MRTNKLPFVYTASNFNYKKADFPCLNPRNRKGGQFTHWWTIHDSNLKANLIYTTLSTSSILKAHHSAIFYTARFPKLWSGALTQPTLARHHLLCPGCPHLLLLGWWWWEVVVGSSGKQRQWVGLVGGARTPRWGQRYSGHFSIPPDARRSPLWRQGQ